MLDGDLVPIIIKVQRLQAVLLERDRGGTEQFERQDAFGSFWNWVDAYVHHEYPNALYRMQRY